MKLMVKMLCFIMQVNNYFDQVYMFILLIFETIDNVIPISGIASIKIGPWSDSDRTNQNRFSRGHFEFNSTSPS